MNATNTIRGEVRLTNDAVYYDQDELFVPVRVESPDSLLECVDHHSSKQGVCKYTKDPVLDGTWHDRFSKLGKKFPQWLPLSVFVNTDGTYKQNDEEVFCSFAGKELILTCVPVDVEDFDEGLASRVKQAANTLSLSRSGP